MWHSQLSLLHIQKLTKLYKSFFQVYPSSFSIAALIGAAAIRERVATKLRWKDPEDLKPVENNHEDEDETRNQRRRKISGDSESGLDLKKLKSDCSISVFKNENLVNDEPKNEPFVTNEPMLEQIKLAKRLLRDPKELLKAPESKPEYDSEDDLSETDVKSSYPLPALTRPKHSSAEQKLTGTNQCMIQSNSKLLEKVRNFL